MNQSNQAILNRIKGGLVVSCQALKEEPLYSSYIMSRPICEYLRTYPLELRLRYPTHRLIAS